jgi:hypothetical protein
MSVIVREPDGQNRLLVKVIWCFINRLTFIRNENSNNLFEAYIIDTHEAGHLKYVFKLELGILFSIKIYALVHVSK